MTPPPVDTDVVIFVGGDAAKIVEGIVVRPLPIGPVIVMPPIKQYNGTIKICTYFPSNFLSFKIKFAHLLTN